MSCEAWPQDASGISVERLQRLAEAALPERCGRALARTHRIRGRDFDTVVLPVAVLYVADVFGVVVSTTT